MTPDRTSPGDDRDPLVERDDVVVPFMFEKLPVRGAIIQLRHTWARMQLAQTYSAGATEILGQSAAATALIAQSLKFDGSITLQLSGGDALPMLVMQCSDQLEMRGMASVAAGSGDVSYRELTAGCRCAVTIDAGNMERPYQGIVEVQGESLAESFEHYFARSAQLPSHMALVADRFFSGGILLQKMPGTEIPLADDWKRIGLLAATLRIKDLNSGIGAGLLSRLFADDDLRLFASRPLQFRCRCSRTRAQEVLRLIGRDEAQDACAERGRVDVTCEYCGQRQTFDAVDVANLFAGAVAGASDTLH